MKGMDGYFLAKREMQDALDSKIGIAQEKLAAIECKEENVMKHVGLRAQIQVLEEIRSYVRNAMLWDTKNDKKKEKG